MSSLILLVIVAAWAVVLVPMLLNRHESASEIRSVDRFATAMRVLARRTATSGDRRYVVVPRRPDSPPNVVVNGTSQWVHQAAEARRRMSAAETPGSAAEVAESPATTDVTASRDAAAVRAAVAVRRLRVLSVLAGAVVALLVLALVAGPSFWIGQALCDALLAAYVIHLRREATRARARRLRAAARARRAAAAAAARPAYARAAAPPAHLVTPPGALVIERQEDGSWIPVPVPLPTYVNAPLGPPPATIATEPAAGLTTEEDLDRRLDEMERRLAVND